MHRRHLASQLTRASHRILPQCALTRRSSSNGGSSSGGGGGGGGGSSGGGGGGTGGSALEDKMRGEHQLEVPTTPLQQQLQLQQLQQQQFYHAEANFIAKGVQLITRCGLAPNPNP